SAFLHAPLRAVADRSGGTGDRKDGVQPGDRETVRPIRQAPRLRWSGGLSARRRTPPFHPLSPLSPDRISHRARAHRALAGHARISDDLRSKKMKLTVSMITMNEEGAIAKVVRDIRGVAPDAEILIVDSSKDRTAEIAQDLGCRVIKQFPPQGYGPAMDRAVREAAGDIVITLDCDDTYPVEVIPRLV